LKAVSEQSEIDINGTREQLLCDGEASQPVSTFLSTYVPDV